MLALQSKHALIIIKNAEIHIISIIIMLSTSIYSQVTTLKRGFFSDSFFLITRLFLNDKKLITTTASISLIKLINFWKYFRKFLLKRILFFKRNFEHSKTYAGIFWPKKEVGNDIIRRFGTCFIIALVWCGSAGFFVKLRTIP